MTDRKMKLIAYLKTGPTANIPGAWRHASANLDDLFTPDRYEQLARALEAAMFDGCFFADTFGVSDIYGGSFHAFLKKGGQISYLDPMIVAPLMTRATKHLGVGATLSTTFHPPYLLARMLATLDMVSGGRACWNIVTSHADHEARNFGMTHLPPKDLRYDQADEVLEACCALWDSWDEDALVLDKAGGTFADPDKVHYANYEGRFIRTKGPLGVPHTPQGRPVFLQAGSSPRGRDFAARWAEAVFATNNGREQTIKFYNDLRGRMSARNRNPDDCRILLSISMVVGETESIAKEKADYLLSLVEPEMVLAMNSSMMGVDLSKHTTLESLTSAQGNQGIGGTQDKVMLRAAAEGTSIVDAAKRLSHGLLIGTASSIADQMQDIFESGGCDGFIVSPTVSPLTFEEFGRLVTPELQRRNLLRTAYSGKTMRENLRD
jgi:FMN-dependent oxidoreductase (nitrilotriacetate monooxygenase family)